MRYFFFVLILFSFSLNAEPDLYIIHVIPKCGVHYIQRISHMLTGKRDTAHNVSSNSLRKAKREDRILRTIQPYDSRAIHLLKKKQYKVVAMVRDPRDALASMLLHMRTFEGGDSKRDFFAVPANFDQLKVDEQLKFLIEGVHGLSSYLDFYEERAKWSLNKYVYTIRYEDLVGDESQRRTTISKLSDYLGIELSAERLEWIVKNVYSSWGTTDVGSVSYKRGRQGGWREIFNDEHKALFKKRFGKKLIKLGYEKDMNW